MSATATLPEALAAQLDAGALDRVEAAVLHGREGEVFEAVVLAQRGDGARVQLTDPPVSAKVKGLDAAAGATVLLRLVSASISDGTVTFAGV